MANPLKDKVWKWKRSKQRKAGTAPRMTPKVPSPTRVFEVEEEEQQALEGEEGEEASGIMGAEEGIVGLRIAPSVMVVGDTQAVRVERAFDVGEKADLDAVALVMSVMGLVDLVNPPPRMAYKKWSSSHWRDTHRRAIL